MDRPSAPRPSGTKPSAVSQASRFQSFNEFYPYYKSEHKRRGTRTLHFIGTSGVLATVAAAVTTRQPKLLPLALVCGYGFAWIGHFFVEHNRPATFKYPLWSLLADFKMFFNMLTGREGWAYA